MLVNIMLAVATFAANSIPGLSQTSLILIGVVLLVLIVASIGGVLLLRRRKTVSKQNSVLTAFDTSILPNLHSGNVASVFRRRDELPISLRSPSAPRFYGTVPAPAPATSPYTTVKMQNSSTQQDSSASPIAASPISPGTPSLSHLPDASRTPSQVSSETNSRQQAGLDTVLEAMIRQAQRGIFSIPGKDDLL